MKTKRIIASLIAAAAALSMAVTASAAAATVDDEILPADDEPVVTEPAEVLPEEPVAPAEPVAPVSPAPNPTTGNSPIAFAVIPVALAAAAVVAKKARK
jgi:hypothetical protein